MEILVIGCGVNGLTSGLCLLEAGHTVSIWAKELPPNTTSNRAAAIWYPYKARSERVTAWGTRSYQAFKRLRAVEESGVIWESILEFKVEESSDPPWVAAVEGFRH